MYNLLTTRFDEMLRLGFPESLTAL